jgi:hypothetical protein
MKVFILLFAVFITDSVISSESKTQLNLYKCDSKGSALTCEKCKRAHNLAQVVLSSNSVSQSVIVSYRSNNETTLRKSFKNCTFVSRNEWQCESRVEIGDAYATSTEVFLSGRIFTEVSYHASIGRKPLALYSCAK